MCCSPTSSPTFVDTKASARRSLSTRPTSSSLVNGPYMSAVSRSVERASYVVPYMKPAGVAVRPLPLLSSVQVVQTLSAGIDSLEPGLKHLRAGVQVCNARGVHEASTAELALTLILASLRGVPDFVR